MVAIKQWLVSSGIASKVVLGNSNRKLYITVHETGNANKGANANAHARLQELGNARQASWHWQVDDKEAIQSFLHSASCMHAGDGRGNGNLHSIGIEICVNSDGDFKKAIENAAALVRHIMLQEKITIQNVVQHNHWSGKNCPTFLRNGSKGINWSDFIKLVKAEPKKEEVKVAKEEYERDAKVGPALATKFNLAVEAGITDGTYPHRPATRAEVAVMIYNSTQKK